MTDFIDITYPIIILSVTVSKSSMNPEELVCVTSFMVMSAFLVIDSLQAIHETVTEHHVYGPAKVRCGLIGSGSWRQSILAQSVMEIKMLCNGNMAKKLQLGKNNQELPNSCETHELDLLSTYSKQPQNYLVVSLSQK